MPVTQSQRIKLDSFQRQNYLRYLPTPNSNKTEILYELIGNGSASIKTFGYMCGFRTRISELCLRDNLRLNKETLTDINKFGNTYTYVNHILPTAEVKKAIKIYKQISSQK